MALPTLNNTPKYDIVIPSTRVKTRFRPYLVKEEKTLLLALEDGEDDTIAKAVLDLIAACVDDIDQSKLKTYDMDYMFCQIRAKSVGETIKFSVKCEDATCEFGTEVTGNLSTVLVETDNTITAMVEISPSIIVEMEHVSYVDIINNSEISIGKTDSEIIFATVVACIKAVHTDDERIEAKNESEEDLKLFVDSMTTNQYTKLKTFIANIPQVTLDINWDCGGCGKHQTMKLKGLSDFFL